MIEVKDLQFNLGQFALKKISLAVGKNEFFVILGHSGAGKTVLLECIAGIHQPRQGEIWIEGHNVSQLRPEQRQMGYVPQDYVLFPFLNVRENIIFGLKRRGLDKAEIQKRLYGLVDLLGLADLLERDATSLSGGEKQRVALARALATQPGILLLDEPLSNLDVQTAKHLRLGLKRIHNELGITTIHITHNHEEAQELGDRVAIMNNGEILQVGRANDIFFSPKNDVVSSFIGSLNIMPCDDCQVLTPGLVQVSCRGMQVIIPHVGSNIAKLAIAPGDVYISDVLPPGPAINRYTGVIREMQELNTMIRLNVQVGDNMIKAEMPLDLAETMKLIPGKEIYLILKLRSLKSLQAGEA
ncbi:MAG TPA: ABC transporter ATP-binding protein [Dehalococcoidia bacterium]|nr:ABC transporter ATP-binding protein [Dehalococcoidia bacterium]